MSGMDLLESHRPQMVALCREYGVTRLRVFGSALTENWDVDKSDFDFAVECGPPPAGFNSFTQFFTFAYLLEELVGRRIDLVDWNAARKPELRQEIDRTAIDLYAA